MDGLYYPFDVHPDHLAGVINALRQCEGFVGGNVTVPYKESVMQFLDEINPQAASIGAVNTIKRNLDGKLVGYNTDAGGVIGALTKTMPWQTEPLRRTLDGAQILLLGAGGAARATAFGVAASYGATGRLLIANRTKSGADSLAESIRAIGGQAEGMSQESIPQVIGQVDIVINTSTKGQSGVQHLPDNRVTYLEPYSSLAPASPVGLDEGQAAGSEHSINQWFNQCLNDLISNLTISLQCAAASGPETIYFDAIYAPAETTMLNHARLSGHRTLNGINMVLIQAADSFANIVLKDHFESNGWDSSAIRERAIGAMAASWKGG
jgi:shikimate dehydrogenase